jgi:hypothetical protein
MTPLKTRRERRISAARERMLDALVRGGADPEALEIISRPAKRTGRLSRFLGTDVELIARRVVR